MCQIYRNCLLIVKINCLALEYCRVRKRGNQSYTHFSKIANTWLSCQLPNYDFWYVSLIYGTCNNVHVCNAYSSLLNYMSRISQQLLAACNLNKPTYSTACLDVKSSIHTCLIRLRRQLLLHSCIMLTNHILHGGEQLNNLSSRFIPLPPVSASELCMYSSCE